MLMSAVAGIDDRTADPIGQVVWCAGMAVADNNDIGRHGFDIFGCIFESFTFDHR